MQRRDFLVLMATTTTPLVPGCFDEDFDHRVVEDEFVDLLNKERQQRGLHTVTQWDVLTGMAEDHAVNMREHDYIGHVQPDGTTAEDRFRENGLLPECEIPTGDGRYYAGGENAIGAYVNQRMERADTGEIIRITSEEELAEYFFESWMDSYGHRNAMLTAAVGRVGLGISINDDGEVYAALKMCS